MMATKKATAAKPKDATPAVAGTAEDFASKITDAEGKRILAALADANKGLSGGKQATYEIIQKLAELDDWVVAHEDEARAAFGLAMKEVTTRGDQGNTELRFAQSLARILVKDITAPDVTKYSQTIAAARLLKKPNSEIASWIAANNGVGKVTQKYVVMKRAIKAKKVMGFTDLPNEDEYNTLRKELGESNKGEKTSKTKERFDAVWEPLRKAGQGDARLTLDSTKFPKGFYLFAVEVVDDNGKAIIKKLRGDEDTEALVQDLLVSNLPKEKKLKPGKFEIVLEDPDWSKLLTGMQWLVERVFEDQKENPLIVMRLKDGLVWVSGHYPGADDTAISAAVHFKCDTLKGHLSNKWLYLDGNAARLLIDLVKKSKNPAITIEPTDVIRDSASLQITHRLGIVTDNPRVQDEWSLKSHRPNTESLKIPLPAETLPNRYWEFVSPVDVVKTLQAADDEHEKNRKTLEEKARRAKDAKRIAVKAENGTVVIGTKTIEGQTNANDETGEWSMIEGDLSNALKLIRYIKEPEIGSVVFTEGGIRLNVFGSGLVYVIDVHAWSEASGKQARTYKMSMCEII